MNAAAEVGFDRVRPSTSTKLPITVLIGTRNEAANIRRCLEALGPASEIVVVDSRSTDGTAEIAASLGARVIPFNYGGGYPKKRQWALEQLTFDTPWILLVDADEVVPPSLWAEIGDALARPDAPAAFVVKKGFHFLGRRFRFGGFSFGAVLLVRQGAARFEELVEFAGDSLDVEVHERVIVNGPIESLRTPLIHEDFKGLEAYLDRHNRYSTWESRLRHRMLTTGSYGQETIRPRLFGNTQERRRFLKRLIVRCPGEPLLWFAYHYFLRLGFLEGRAGLIASRIRAGYIRDVRSKMYELGIAEQYSHAKKPR